MTDAFEREPLHPESWARHARSLKRVAYALLGDVHASEDVVQTAALRALSRPPRVLSRAWLERVVKNLARDLQRRRSREQAEPPTAEALQARIAPSSDEVAERLALGRLVLEAVNALDEPYRRAVYLRYFEGMSVEEVARALQVPRRTAQTRLYRGLAKLREQLGDARSDWRAVAYGLIAPRAQPATQPMAHAGRVGPPVASAQIQAGASILMLKKLSLVTFALVAAIGVWMWADTPLPTVPVTRGEAQGADPAPALAPEALVSATDRREEPQASPSSPVPESTRSAGAGSLRVRVIWPEGEPAAGVAVLVRSVRADLPDRSLAREFSDESGETVFDELEAGSVSVSCVRAGSRPTRIDIVAGEEQAVTLRLRPGVGVQGVVRDDTGHAVPGAEIWLTTGSTDWQGGHVVARCDRAGRFDLRELPARQSLAAIAEGYAPSALLDLELLDLEEQPVQVTLTLRERGGALEGVVLAPDGNPVAGAWVAVGSSPRFHGLGRAGNSIEHWTPRTVRTDEGGGFRVGGLAAGVHEVWVRGATFPVWKGSSEIRVSETTHLRVQFVDGARVSGSVRDGAGQPVAHATVSAFDRPLGGAGRSGAGFLYAGAFAYPSVSCDDDGRYELTGLPAGMIELYACEGPPRLNPDRPHAKRRIEVQPGEHVIWDAVLGEGRVVHGRVTYRNGSPIVLAMVSLRADLLEPGEEQAPEYARPTDREGRFRFVDLDPRSYTLRVELDGLGSERGPLEAKGVWPDGPEIVLAADFDPPTHVERSTVVGLIHDAGRRFEGCKLELLLETEDHAWRIGAEKQGERFRFDAVEPGKYKLVALCGEDPIVHSEWFEVLPGATYDIGVLVTQPAGGLELHLARGPGTEACIPVAVVRPADSWQGKRQELRGGDVHELDGLSPGPYLVHLYGMGMANVEREVEVIAGQLSRLELALEAAVMCPLEVDWPEGALFKTLELRVTDDAGTTRWSQTLINGNSLDRPYRRGLNLPVGRFTLHGESDGGHAGAVAFEVLDLERKPAKVRLELH